MLAGCISSLFLFVLTFVMTILIMIYGWGLEPKSWWWIIGGTFINIFCVGLLQSITQEFNKKNG